MYTQGHKSSISREIKDSNKEQLVENWMNINLGLQRTNLCSSQIELKRPRRGKRCKALKRG